MFLNIVYSHLLFLATVVTNGLPAHVPLSSARSRSAHMHPLLHPLHHHLPLPPLPPPPPLPAAATVYTHALLLKTLLLL
jgi:hypothetical protein